MMLRKIVQSLPEIPAAQVRPHAHRLGQDLLHYCARRLPAATLRSKIALLVFVVLGVSMFTFYMITAQVINDYVLDEMIKRAVFLSRNIATSVGYSAVSGDLLGMDAVVSKATGSNQDVAYVAVVDDSMKVLAHSDVRLTGTFLTHREGKTIRQSSDTIAVREVHQHSGSLLEIASPVTFMNRSFGTVLFGIHKRALDDAQATTRLKILGAFGVLLLFGVAGAVVLSSLIARPIQELASGVEELKKGTGNKPLTVYANDELGRLTESFNEMTALITDQRDRLNEYSRDLEESYVSIVKVVAAALDARDPYTHGHSVRVARLALAVGKRVGLGREDLSDLEVACLLHDIGKMRIPDSILRKKSRLDPAEYREIMSHTHYGADILKKAPSLQKYIPSVRHHHEWYNGKGYPDGLSGNNIPLHASIIAIADAFDAMTSDRPYRGALSEAEALQEMRISSGIQFNPELLEIFLSTMERKDRVSACASAWEL